MDGEKKFLHDISSPITTVRLNLENVLLVLGDRKPEEIDLCVQMLQASLGQLDRVTAMIGDRRVIAKKEEE